MRIPPYWAKGSYANTDREGRTRRFLAWGWSFVDLSEAKEEAVARAKRIFERLTSGQPTGSYDYLECPLREEIVDTFKDGDDQVAVLTRNRYGSLVLNSASTCFADVDFPRLRSNGLIDAILLLFSRSRRQERMQAARDATVQAV